MDYPEGRGPDVNLIMSNDGKRIVLVLMCVCVRERELSGCVHVPHVGDEPVNTQALHHFIQQASFDIVALLQPTA